MNITKQWDNIEIKLDIVLQGTDDKILLVKVVSNEWQCKLIFSCP